MIKRIELIIQSQNLTPSQFADRIGIQRSGLSHILSGRNNPSLDFVQKVLAAFPELDPGWLLQGRGRMYANLSDLPIGNTRPATDLFSVESFPAAEIPEDRFPILNEDEKFSREMVSGGAHFRELPDEPEEETAPNRDISGTYRKSSHSGRTEKLPEAKLQRILFFYEDGTFEEYTPR